MDLNTLVEKAYSFKKEIEDHNETAKILGEKLQEIQNQIMEVMREQNISSLKHALCTVIMNTRFTVKNPATPEDKKNFFDYLQVKGIFEDMVSVNSQKLNAWYKEEIEVAKKDGNFGFKVPGIGDPTAFEYITFRKA